MMSWTCSKCDQKSSGKPRGPSDVNPSILHVYLVSDNRRLRNLGFFSFYLFLSKSENDSSNIAVHSSLSVALGVEMGLQSVSQRLSVEGPALIVTQRNQRFDYGKSLFVRWHKREKARGRKSLSPMHTPLVALSRNEADSAIVGSSQGAAV